VGKIQARLNNVVKFIESEAKLLPTTAVVALARWERIVSTGLCFKEPL
jgi:hypothetical protein